MQDISQGFFLGGGGVAICEVEATFGAEEGRGESMRAAVCFYWGNNGLLRGWLVNEQHNSS